MIHGLCSISHKYYILGNRLVKRQLQHVELSGHQSGLFAKFSCDSSGFSLRLRIGQPHYATGLRIWTPATVVGSLEGFSSKELFVNREEEG